MSKGFNWRRYFDKKYNRLFVGKDSVYYFFDEKMFLANYTDFVLDSCDEECAGYAVYEASQNKFKCIGNDYSGSSVVTNNNIGIRPCVDYSLIENYSIVLEDNFDNLFIQFGEYPSSRVKIDDVEILNETGKFFTIKENDNLVQLKEYICNDGRRVVKRKNNFYLVEPLHWYVNKQYGVATTKNVISVGFAFSRKLTINELGSCLMNEMSHSPYFDEESAKLYILDELMPYKYNNDLWSQSRIDKISLDIRKGDSMLIEGFLYNILSEEILGKELIYEMASESVSLQTRK